MENFGEKGAWAYPGTAQFFWVPPIVSGMGKATEFKNLLFAPRDQRAICHRLGISGISPGAPSVHLFPALFSHLIFSNIADDSQLVIALSPTSYLSDIRNLTQCLCALRSWFCLKPLLPDRFS